MALAHEARVLRKDYNGLLCAVIVSTPPSLPRLPEAISLHPTLLMLLLCDESLDTRLCMKSSRLNGEAVGLGAPWPPDWLITGRGIRKACPGPHFASVSETKRFLSQPAKPGLLQKAV